MIVLESSQKTTFAGLMLHIFSISWSNTICAVVMNTSKRKVILLTESKALINDLGVKLNELIVGINIGEHKLNLLMYADDIVHISPDARSAQQQLDILTKWCSMWGMYINAKTSQVIHVSPHQRKRDNTILHCMDQDLMYVDTYKYLGYHIHEHLTHTTTADILTTSARRVFGRVIGVFKKLKKTWAIKPASYCMKVI